MTAIAKSLNVYIDGACIYNGYTNAKAGYAVFFGENDARNEYKQVSGKQSNNTAELTAFIRCVQILATEVDAQQPVCIYTDSEYVIKCATTYGSKLAKADWKPINGKAVPNLELVREAYTLFNVARLDRHIQLHYIEAHTNKNDVHSKGNAEADRLAKLSIGIASSMECTESTKDKSKEFINLEWITYDTKDAAKALGAKWNQKDKVWYVNANTSEETLHELMKLQTTPEIPVLPKVKGAASCNVNENTKRIYIKIDYAKKDVAKKLGAKWDASVKSWYYIDGQISEENKNKLSAL